MLLYAIKMLIGDKAKYISIILGLSFASFIISQQAAIMIGIMKRTYGFVTDTSQGNIWVTDPTVQYIDDIKGMKETFLYRVRSVEGVEWAVPIFKGMIQARLPSGVFQTTLLIGIDDATLIGGPPKMVEGHLINLRRQDAIIVNDVGANTKLATKKNGKVIPLRIGDTMELNDHRAVVVGISQVSRTFQSQPVIYTTYSNATTWIPAQRKLLAMILVKSKPGWNPEEVVKRIQATTQLSAYTTEQFKHLTLSYYTKYTGIVVNFGVAIIMGFIIGTAIAGQALYNFTLDHLPFFGVFKAMGADNALLMKMILLQTIVVSAIGWGIGIGAAALFYFFSGRTELSFNMPLYLFLLSGGSILMISLVGALFSIRKVMRLDPAVVFKS